MNATKRMDKPIDESRHGRWVGVVLLPVMHLLAFGGLYLVLVQICWSFQDHYAAVGLAETLRFRQLRAMSDLVAGYTFVFLLLISLDAFVVARLARKANRWTSAYSHAVLFSIGTAMFIAIAWMIQPMVWGRPRTARPAVADANQGDVAETRSLSLTRIKD
ncbi:MAG: hypothetical protein ACR2NZ_05500 [Rubripirellula sp.]